MLLLRVNEVAKRVVKVIFVNGAYIQPKFGFLKNLCISMWVVISGPDLTKQM